MIRVQQLVKKFGDFTAVDNVSFDVAKGEIFAFLGPNGAGKTTTIKMLTTLLAPTSGTLEIDGKNPVEKQHAELLLKLFELWDRKDSLVKQFSGGMKRRLEIARGFLHTPKILFLDEPTLGLDPQSRNQLWTHVKYLNQNEGVTVFLTTHYMDEADRVANRIAVIDHGKIVAMGSSAELKAQTEKESLEDAFLVLTGAGIRDEAAGSAEQIRQVAKMGGRR